MSYHNRIMNIRHEIPAAMKQFEERLYKEGHRDARHAAAEVANEAVNEIDGLNRKLNLIISLTEFMDSCGPRINVDLVDFYEDISTLIRAVSIGNLVSWLSESPTVLRLRGYYGIGHGVWEYIRLEEE